MRFYNIKQYGKSITMHIDKAYSNEKGLAEVCNRIVKKAKKAVKNRLMVEGMFDVVVCNKYGTVLDSFTSSTDYEY